MTSSSTTSSASRPGFTVPLVLAGLVVVLDGSVTIVAMPVLIAELGSSLPVVQWVTTGYLLGLVAVLPTAAWLMGRFGTRAVFLAALAIFTVASGCAALAWDVESLIAARVVQGLGGGLINPVSQAVALGATARERRGRMMSILGLPVLFGPLLGPILSGWLIDHASWRLIFAINLPIGIAVIILAARLLPFGTTTARTGLDWIGAALLPSGAVLLVLGLTMIAQDGLSTPALTVVAAGALAMVAFVVRALRIEHPLLRLRLLRKRTLAAGTGVAVAFGAAYFGGLTILPNYVQAVRGDPALLAGTLAIPQALAVGITMQIATRLIDRLSARTIMVTAIAIGLTGTLGLAVAVAANAPYPVIVACTVAFGIGSGGTLMPAMTAATRDLGPDELPSGTTLMGLLQQLSTSLGMATITLVLVVSANTVPVAEGAGLDRLITLPDAERATWLDELGAAVAPAYLVVAALMITALLIAAIFLRSHTGPARSPESQPLN